MIEGSVNPTFKDIKINPKKLFRLSIAASLIAALALPACAPIDGMLAKATSTPITPPFSSDLKVGDDNSPSEGEYDMRLNEAALVDYVTVSDVISRGGVEFTFVLDHSRAGFIEVAGQLRHNQSIVSSFAQEYPVYQMSEVPAHEIKVDWRDATLTDEEIDGNHIRITAQDRINGIRAFQQKPNSTTLPFPDPR